MYSRLPSSKTPHFLQNEAKYTAFIMKMSFICMRMKIISISKAEHLPSFWYKGFGGTRKWPIVTITVKCGKDG